MRKKSKSGKKLLKNAKASFQKTSQELPGSLEDDIELGEEDLELVKEYGDSLGFLKQLKQEDLTRRVENCPAPSASRQESRAKKEMDDIEWNDEESLVDSHDDWEDFNEEDLNEEDFNEEDQMSTDSNVLSQVELMESVYERKKRKKPLDAEDAEEDYELKPRNKKIDWQDISSSRLPIIHESGVVQENNTPLIVNKAPPAPKKTQEYQTESNDSEDSNQVPQMDPSSDKKPTTLAGKQERLAELASLIMEDPERHIALLKDLREYSKDNSKHVCKLALLTQLAVYKDIIPGYRIRQLSEAEKTAKISKEVRKLRQYEDILISNYQAYLQHIGRIVEGFPSRDAYRNESESILQQTAIYCLTDLLTSVPHFNFRMNIIMAVVGKMAIKNHPEIGDSCCKAIITLFQQDESGEASLEAVKLIAKMVKARNFNVREEVLKTFLHLRFGDDAIRFLNEQQTKKKEKKSEYISKKVRKAMKEKKAIEQEMKEAEAVVSKEERAKMQTEILKFVFVTYFRVLKNAPHSPALPAVLAGLSKFAHLINVDFFEDLLGLLKALSQEQLKAFLEPGSFESSNKKSNLSNPISNFHCINASFQVLSGQGEALDIDLKDFCAVLYAQLLQIPLLRPEELIRQSKPGNTLNEHQRTALDLALHGVQLMMMKRKEVSAERVASFVKRLTTISLHVPSEASLSCLNVVRQLLMKYPKIKNLLDPSEMSGVGLFRPELLDPELCNPFATSLWELVPLMSHYNPNVRTMSISLSKD